MHVILFYHKNTLYAVVNGVIFQVRKDPKISLKHFSNISPLSPADPGLPGNKFTYAYNANR